MPTPNLLTPTLTRFIEAERLPASFLSETVPGFQALSQHIATRAGSTTHPFVVGLCGPQGSGKSTLAALLRLLLEADRYRVATLSLDDFYLPRAARSRLAAKLHPLLATRGVPGTHDVALALETLDALSTPGELALPSFDKATDDRRPRDAWPRVKTPVDIVIFEGWCTGARAQAPAALAQPINTLERMEDRDGTWRRYVNEQLQGGYQALFARIDLLMLLAAESFDTVFEWRAEQERKLRERIEQQGADGPRLMSEAELRRFIAHYERLTRHILDEMPQRADVVVALDRTRRIQQLRGITAAPSPES